MNKPISLVETSVRLGMSVPAVRQELEAGKLSSLVIDGKRHVILPRQRVLNLPTGRQTPALTLLDAARYESGPDLAA